MRKTTARPTLVELIRRHLAEQNEPRSAAEISTALSQAHPERDIKTKVVRVTTEGLGDVALGSNASGYDSRRALAARALVSTFSR
ncbi:hypothetical protein [Streptomyces sp. NPDC096142]|uniref:hypothetical protein n=1 Tax=Streptomyces sp. NPDC096142 TaxID=3366077 RepID=UPI0037F9885B